MLIKQHEKSFFSCPLLEKATKSDYCLASIASPNNAIEARSKKYHNSTRDGGRN
jgi:hypothetical protein